MEKGGRYLPPHLNHFHLPEAYAAFGSDGELMTDFWVGVRTLKVLVGVVGGNASSHRFVKFD